MVPVDQGELDALCICCPDTDECYYLRPGDDNEDVTLRVVAARNGPQHCVRPASHYRLMPV